MLAGGIAAGVIGSRLLPPLVAMARGKMKGDSGDPFQKLEEDHRFILSTLQSMEAEQDSGAARRLPLFLMLKRKLAKHALAEEDVVYPLLIDEAERREATKRLYDEHADMKVLLFEIENAIMDGKPWDGAVGRLREMVERHAREEETEQFPRLRQILAERMGTVAAQVLREEALIL